MYLMKSARSCEIKDLVSVNSEEMKVLPKANVISATYTVHLQDEYQGKALEALYDRKWWLCMLQMNNSKIQLIFLQPSSPTFMYPSPADTSKMLTKVATETTTGCTYKYVISENKCCCT
jgi:hypothetical protein